jgi:cytoskeletal protein RodZ
MEPDGRKLRVEFGAALRAARESRGLDTRAAAAACRLSADQVQGLEQGQSGSFYSAAYEARAARSYAAFLGVALTEEYAQAPPPVLPAAPVAAVRSMESVTAPLGSRRPNRTALILLATALVVGVALFLFIAKWEPGRGPVQAVPEAKPPAGRSPTAQSAAASPAHDDALSRQSAAPSSVPAPAPAPVPVPVPASRGRDDASAGAHFFLQVFSEVGLTAKDSTGKVLIHGRLSPIAGKRLTGSPPFSVVATDAEAIAVFYRGRRVRLAREADGEWRADFGAP